MWHHFFLPSPFLPSRFSLSGTEPERSFRLSTRSETDTRLGLDWCRWEKHKGATSSVSAVGPPWFLSQSARLVFGAGTSPCVLSVFCSVTLSAFLRSIQQSGKNADTPCARLWRQLIALFSSGPSAFSFGSLFRRQMDGQGASLCHQCCPPARGSGEERDT